MIDLLNEIKKLSEKDLVFLYGEIGKMLNSSSYTEGKIVYEALTKNIKNQRHVPFNVFMNGKLLGRFVSFTESMVQVSKKLKVQNFTLFCNIAIPSLIDRLNDMKIPATIATVLNQRDYIEVSLDQAYPGYMKSGLMGIVFNGGRFKKVKP